MLRTWMGLLLLGGCATTHQQVVLEPMLLAASSAPVPPGTPLGAPVEARACSPDYTGLRDLIAEARAGADALVEVSVEIERTYMVVENAWGRVDDVIPGAQCFVLRGYQVELE